ncbi:unnamed protein product [Lactuca saligna]|uniref:Uncharacterized protein n=1 Tax=Lactuca saligna TaxID=75948 RepID=A0AA35V5B6_LACSI|nr:unnamed protein product [Lactuca saligna]
MDWIEKITGVIASLLSSQGPERCLSGSPMGSSHHRSASDSLSKPRPPISHSMKCLRQLRVNNMTDDSGKTYYPQRGFEQQWLSITISKAIFLGNGLVAILASLFGNLLVGSLAMGAIAPFDAASIFLAIGMAIIISSWTENYGDSSESKALMT